MTVRRWTWGLVAAWAALIAASEVRSLMPAAVWYVPGEMVIEDTTSGTCPHLTFTRAIKRAFHGRFTVTLQRQAPGGGWFVAHRPWTGEGDYRPDAVLPEPLTLQWWTWDDGLACDWPPGVYRLLTEWMIQPGGPDRYARATSNAFRVHP